MCGEQTYSVVLSRIDPGSPPRVRGTGRGWLFTPRAAGDHPRVCGEQSSPFVCVAVVCGSPPRVRGTVIPSPRVRGEVRITPACAGNSMATA